MGCNDTHFCCIISKRMINLSNCQRKLSCTMCIILLNPGFQKHKSFTLILVLAEQKKTSFHFSLALFSCFEILFRKCMKSKTQTFLMQKFVILKTWILVVH